MIKLTLIALTILTTACAGNETKPVQANNECPDYDGPVYVNQWIYMAPESEKDSFGVLVDNPYEFFNSDRPTNEG